MGPTLSKRQAYLECNIWIWVKVHNYYDTTTNTTAILSDYIVEANKKDAFGDNLMEEVKEWLAKDGMGPTLSETSKGSEAPYYRLLECSVKYVSLFKRNEKDRG